MSKDINQVLSKVGLSDQFLWYVCDKKKFIDKVNEEQDRLINVIEGLHDLIHPFETVYAKCIEKIVMNDISLDTVKKYFEICKNGNRFEESHMGLYMLLCNKISVEDYIKTVNMIKDTNIDSENNEGYINRVKSDMFELFYEMTMDGNFTQNEIYRVVEFMLKSGMGIIDEQEYQYYVKLEDDFGYLS